MLTENSFKTLNTPCLNSILLKKKAVPYIKSMTIAVTIAERITMMLKTGC